MKQIDQRNPRFATIKSSVLANGSSGCLVGEKAGNRLVIECTEAIAPFTTATVTFDDMLFLGEVVTVSQDSDCFRLELKVEQVLSGLQSLMALRTRLLGDGPATAPSFSPFAAQQQTPVYAGR